MLHAKLTSTEQFLKGSFITKTEVLCCKSNKYICSNNKIFWWQSQGRKKNIISILMLVDYISNKTNRLVLYLNVSVTAVKMKRHNMLMPRRGWICWYNCLMVNKCALFMGGLSLVCDIYIQNLKVKLLFLEYILKNITMHKTNQNCQWKAKSVLTGMCLYWS